MKVNRIKIQSNGYYYVAENARTPAPLLVGLHGFAQRANDFLEVITPLAGNRFIPVAPQGFHQISRFPSKEVVFSWMSSFEREDNIERNNRFLDGMIDRLTQEGIASTEKAILLGFSQGSSVAYRFAQAHPERVAGIVSVCADLPPDVKSNLAPLAKIPVLVAYSPEDRMVAEEHPLSALDALKSAGVKVESFVFEGDHRVPSSLAGPLQSWANRLF